MGILKVLVSYWVTRVIILVVGTVHGGFWVGLGGSRVVWGGPGRVGVSLGRLVMIVI